MLICSMVILFALCSVVGWVFESLLAIIKTRKWESRGFLYGPVCPIYGVGVVAIVLATKAVVRFAGFDYEWVHIAVASFFGSMILEYVVSWGLEKLFHAYWWDYSDMPLNIHGRTCIPAACLFCIGGLGAVYVIAPAWDAVMAQLPFLLVEVMAFVIVVLFTIDTTLTVSALTSFQSQVIRVEQQFNERAGELTDKVTSIGPNAAEWARDNRDKLSNLGPDAAEWARTNREKLSNLGPDAVEWARTNRDKLRDTTIQDLVESMGASTRSALSRVQGFRIPTHPNRPELPDWASRALEKVKTFKTKR